ncbi:MAG: DHA2 family efflux MFS transporter permease subunit [Longimicrobiales bacterium]
MQYKWKVLVAVLFGVFMVVLDTTVVNVAFQTLRREFGAPLEQSQWIISIYVLSLGIAMPVAGFLADRYGIKRMYVGGLAGFGAGSLLCALAPSLETLIAARALQGLGGGIAVPLGTALLFRAFPPYEQGLALGIFGIALVVAPASGPVLGGWLVDLDAWRLIFLINVPIAAAGVVLGFRFLRESMHDQRPRWDVPGLITAVAGFGALLYAASRAAQGGWLTAPVFGWFALGTAALTVFAVVELQYAATPLLDLRLFGRRVFLIATVLGYIAIVALFGAEFLLPIYLQALRGETALRTGIILLPMAITAGITMPLAGRAYDRIGPRAIMLIGFAALAYNTWQFSELDAFTPISWIVLLLTVRGFALGMITQTTLVSALSVVEPHALPRASSLVNSTRMVVQAVGVAALASIVAATVSTHTAALQRDIRPGIAHAVQTGLCQPAPVSADVAAGSSAAQVPAPESDRERACAESLLGFRRAYRVTFWLSLLAAGLALLLPGWPASWTGRRAAPRREEAVGVPL